jgi:predicted HTH transcriptional regulator
VEAGGQIQLLPPDWGPLFQQDPAATASNRSSPVRARSAGGEHPTPSPVQEETYQLIALLLEERGTITSADAQELTGLDAAGVRPHLQRLVTNGKAVAEGQRRGTRYRLTEA